MLVASIVEKCGCRKNDEASHYGTLGVVVVSP